MEIAFQAKNKFPVCLLSNFFGGSEFTYMALRTNNPNLKGLYSKLKNISYEEFKNYRERLQGKKIYKDKYRDPYYKGVHNGVEYFASGVIAKLISACWKKTMKKRLKVVNQMAEEFGFEANIESTDFLMNPELNEGYMKIALREKFKAGTIYREYLLSTGNAVLYEQKGRGSTGIWTGKDGLLGKLLMELRDEILESMQSNPKKRKRINDYRNLKF